MFIGHWAPALVAAAHPRAPGLGTLFVAGQLVDWGFFALFALGVEHMRLTPGISVMNPMDLYFMPYTHSLLGSLLWASMFAGLLWWWRRDLVTALIGGLVVLSHWFLDLLVHIPDLTLFGAPPRLGLGLWNHPGIAMPLELGLTFGALLFYFWAMRPARPSARLAAGLLAIALLTVQVIGWMSTPPGDGRLAIALSVFAIFGAMSLLAAWTGATRAPRHSKAQDPKERTR